MRRVLLVALSLALAACGGEDDVESGGCTSAIVVHGKAYLGLHVDGPRPPAGPPLDDAVQPACDDGRTRMEGFPGSLPYVQTGDRVMVDAVGCRGEGVVARRIALQP